MVLGAEPDDLAPDQPLPGQVERSARLRDAQPGGLGLPVLGGNRGRSTTSSARCGPRPARPPGSARRRRRRTWSAARRGGRASRRSSARGRRGRAARGPGPAPSRGRWPARGRAGRGTRGPAAMTRAARGRSLRSGRSGGVTIRWPCSSAASTHSARPATVGFSNRGRSGRSTPKASRIREIARVARSEWPPEVEEVVVDPDLVEVEDARPDRRDALLRLVPGGDERPVEVGPRATRGRAGRGGRPCRSP